MDRLFAPRSVAVVGASADPERLNGRPVRFLMEKGFPGEIYPVNPRRDEILGLRCYPSVSALPEPPDVAYLLVPASVVPDVVAECGEAGVPFVVISSSGFAEVEGGAERQRRLVELARRNGTAVVGPNCEGVWNVGANTLITFGSAAAREDLRPGPISVVSQSGSLGAGLIQTLLDAGLGVNHFVSTGNEAGLDVLDFLAYLVERDDTEVIVLFLEGLRRAERLVEVGRRAAERGKVVLALKSGASEAGRRANASHTGKLSSPDRIYGAALRQAGILRLGTLTEVREAARVFRCLRRAPERGLAVLSISGGARGLLADACAHHGIPLPPFSARTRERLVAVLPGYAVVDNPADLTGDVISQPDLLEQVLQIVGEDDATDAVVLQFANQGVAQAERVGDLVARLTETSGKPVILGFVAGLPPRALRDRLHERGVLTCDDPAAVGRALGWLRERSRMAQDVLAAPAPAPPAAGEPRPDGTGWEAIAPLLERHDVPVAPSRLVEREADVAAAVAELGLPVAAKLPTDEFAHKTEHGGIRLNLADEDAALAAFRELADMPGRSSRRVHLQRQVRDGVEVLASVRRDPDLGGVLAVGPGGVLVELVGELAYRMLPVSEAGVETLLDETRLGGLLGGFRGAPAADRGALVRALIGLCDLFQASPWLEEIELNPLIVLPRGEGVFAVDLAVEPAA
jgi:acetate---CoA ligase (ADP-forming)